MPGALREDAMLISVTRDGNIFFGTHRIRSSDLPASIRESVRRGSERKVYLKVDARAKYGDAAAVIDEIRLVGISGRRNNHRPAPTHCALKRDGSLRAGELQLFS